MKQVDEMIAKLAEEFDFSERGSEDLSQFAYRDQGSQATGLSVSGTKTSRSPA